MNTYLKYITQLGTLSAVVLTVLALLMWIPDFSHADNNYGVIVATLGLTILNGLGLTLLFYESGVTRFLQALPFILYLVVFSSFHGFHTYWQAQLAILLLQPTILFLQHSHLNAKSQETAFISSIFLLVASLFLPAVVWFIPLYWVGLIYQQAFSIRTFLASVLAIAVFAIYYAIAYYFVDWVPEYAIIRPVSFIINMENGGLEYLIYACVVIAVSIFLSANVLWRLHRENNRTRFMAVLFGNMLIGTSVLTLIPVVGSNNLPLLLFVCVALAELYFHQQQSTFRGIIFVVLLVLCSVFGFALN